MGWIGMWSRSDMGCFLGREFSSPRFVSFWFFVVGLPPPHANTPPFFMYAHVSIFALF